VKKKILSDKWNRNSLMEVVYYQIQFLDFIGTDEFNFADREK